MGLKQIIEESRQREPTIREEIDSLRDDDLMDFMNLGSARTGIDGTILISTSMGSHGARVKYVEKTGPGQPSFSVSIGAAPRVLTSSLPERVVARKGPFVLEWVRLNHEALLRFWEDGEFWSEEQVDALRRDLRRVDKI